MVMGFLLLAFFGIAVAGRLLARPFVAADPSRRLFLARSLAAGVGGVVAGLTAAGMKSALGPTQAKELSISLRGLPPGLAGFKLGQISDVHAGPLFAKAWPPARGGGGPRPAPAPRA